MTCRGCGDCPIRQLCDEVGDCYYDGSTIYCTYEFASKVNPVTGWVSNEMKNEKLNNGYLGNYKGHRVIVLDSICHELLAKIYTKGREDAINEIYHKFEEVVKLDTRESYYWTVIWRLFQKMIDEMGKDINVTTKKEGEQDALWNR